MRITLSSITFDTFGYVDIDALPNSTLTNAQRRVSRVATLDGGAVVNDFGFSEADRVLLVRWRQDADIDALVRRMLEQYGRVRISTHDGVFEAALDSYQTRSNEATLTVLVLARLA